MKSIKTAIAAIATLASTIAFGGLYIVSGGDFRTPYFSYILDVPAGVEVSIFEHTQQANQNKYTLEVDDGTIYTNSINDSSFVVKHTFQTAGRHKVKMFNTTPSVYYKVSVAKDYLAQASMYQYVAGSFSGYDGCSNLTKVVIRPGVISVGANSFRNCGKLKEVVIPDTVKSIGHDTFSMNGVLYEQQMLERIVLPRNNSYTNAEANLFFRAKKLKTLSFPPSVKYFQKWVLYQNQDLQEITIGQSEYVDSLAFVNLSALTTVNYYGTLEQWKADPLNAFFGTTTETPEAGVNSVIVSGGSATSGAITLNFNYPSE